MGDASGGSEFIFQTMRWCRLLIIGLLGGGSGGLKADDVEVHDRGFVVYRDNCRECHLGSGMGIPALGVPSIAGLPRWYVTDQLRAFRRGERGADAEDPSGRLMRTKAESIGERDLAFVGRHIESLPPSSTRNALGGVSSPAGQQAYLADCADCHGEQGEGSRGERAPPLIYQPDWYLLKQLENFRDGKRPHRPDESSSEPAAHIAEAIVAWLATIPLEQSETSVAVP